MTHTGLIEEVINRSKQYRNIDCDWKFLADIFTLNTTYIQAVKYMEETGGAPAFMFQNGNTLICMDTSPESPAGRRKLCYDRAALESRRSAKPESDVLTECGKYGIELLTEIEYLDLQKVLTIDAKTSSWVLTPESIREKGGALFGHNRYGRTFIDCNGAQSYYSDRGFRAKIEIKIL